MANPVLDLPPVPEPAVDPAGRVVRSGVCEPVARVVLPWARYRPGCRYPFDVCEGETGRRYVRVFNGPAYGVAGPVRFAELFTEVEG